MRKAFFTAGTIDDLMRDVILEIQTNGKPVDATRGPNRELLGVLLELEDPRARLSSTETRGKLFSCLGELCWYLARSNDADFISYYIPAYTYDAEDGVLHGAYGPRWLDWKGLNQVTNVTETLKKRRSSRQAVVQVFDADDIVGEHRDVPCTCTLQFTVRDDRLQMLTHMRSNDAYLGLPHDVFSFTMLQEIVARSLSVELGSYNHFVGSLHLYDKNKDKSQAFIDEGLQSTKFRMPPMPPGNPWPAISVLLDAEMKIRTQGAGVVGELKDVEPYWADLVRLLQIFRYANDEDWDGIRTIGEKVSVDTYRPFIAQKLSSR